MVRTIAWQVAIGLLLALWLGGSASGASVDGFIEGSAPVTVQGNLQSVTTDSTFWVQNPMQSAPESAFVLRADNATITHVVWETESARAGSTTVALPSTDDGVQRETIHVSDATIALLALDRTADVLLSPSTSGSFLVEVIGEGAQAQVGVAPEGVLVQDGFREEHNVDEGEAHPFDYEHEVPGPLSTMTGAPEIRASGNASGYIWGTHVVVSNTTERIDEYETGAHVEASNEGVTRTERYEYLLLDLEGLQSTLAPGGLHAQVLSPGLSAGLDGEASISDATGNLRTSDGVYEARDEATVDLEGNLSLSFTPRVPGGGSSSEPSRIGIGVRGDIDEVNLPLVTSSSRISTPEIVAYGAGGATVLGLAAWYVASLKGASVAIPLIGRTRRANGRQGAEVVPPVDLDRPGELLFEPDRFSLYHLVRSRPGLCAERCEELTGIQVAREQLDLLVDHGLLEVMSEAPRRYCLPNALTPAEAERVAFLREPAASRLAELLTLHGLTPEKRLLERAANTRAPLREADVQALLDRFVELGLAYREQGEEGPVVDPTDELTDTLRRMGETSIPGIS